MKHLLYISILLFSLTASAQRKHLIKNGEIVSSRLPDVFTYEDGTFIYGGYKNLPDSVHYADGWRTEIVPEWDPETQRLGALYYNVGMNYVTREVIDLTAEELAQRKESLLQSLDDNFDYAQIKALLRMLSKPILESDSVTAQQLEVLTGIYKQYRADKYYEKDEVFVCDSTLYKVVQAHTSQADWLPASTPALYVKYQVDNGQILAWDYPVEYAIDDLVTYNGVTYRCIQAHTSQNGWSPNVVASLWVEN